MVQVLIVLLCLAVVVYLGITLARLITNNRSAIANNIVAVVLIIIGWFFIFQFAGYIHVIKTPVYKSSTK